MSIASEISRLQTAKADIKSSIENKGVTVPSNASIDTYDTYIDQIQTGGGTNYLELYAKNGLTGTITSTQLGTNIGSNMANYLFSNQPNITSVDLTGTGTTKVARNFCSNCSSLTSVTIPNTVTQILDYFCENTSVGSFTIPSSVTQISNYFLTGSKVTSLIIPSSVTKIGEYFCQNTKITSITIPSTVTSLGNDAFNGCSSLTTLIFNAPISNPNQSLCNGTNSLALVDLNSSVTNIRNYSFARGSASTNLLEIVLRRTDNIVTVANAIGSTSFNAAFRNRRNIKLYVPSALIASYEANSNWAAGITAGYLTIVALEGSQYE